MHAYMCVNVDVSTDVCVVKFSSHDIQPTEPPQPRQQYYKKEKT